MPEDRESFTVRYAVMCGYVHVHSKSSVVRLVIDCTRLLGHF